MTKKNLFLILILIAVPLLILIFGVLKNLNKNMVKEKSSPPQKIRPAAVAGQFYPGDSKELKKEVLKYLADAAKKDFAGEIKAILAPHAGYDFSGPVAAQSFQQLEGKKIARVILISNSHRAYFSGVALDENDAWETPLGQILIDREFLKKLEKSSDIFIWSSPAHEKEHALEVQLPFLQTVLKEKFKIVPLLFGNSGQEDYQILAQVLLENLGPEDLLVISSDLSHYPRSEDAQKIDQETLEKIKSGEIENLEKHIKETEQKNIPQEQTLLCGADGVKTLMVLANLKSWNKIEILNYQNSGDSFLGDKTAVVGYGAMAFYERSANQKETESFLNEEQKIQLLQIAKETVESFVKMGKIPDFEMSDERLNQRQGAFVTLKINGVLRGCIGQILPSREPLWQVVRQMAKEAASQDPRFLPVQTSELSNLSYEISVLSEPQKIDDWQKIELGKHGVLVRQGGRSGVFLPQVAEETGWKLEEFLSHLCAEKAGLEKECYKDKENTEVFIFTAQVIDL